MKKTYSFFLVILLLYCSELSGQNRVVVDFSFKSSGEGYENGVKYDYRDYNVYYDRQLYKTERVSSYLEFNNSRDIIGYNYWIGGHHYNLIREPFKCGFLGAAYCINPQTKEMIKYETNHDLDLWFLQNYYETYEFTGQNKPFFTWRPNGKACHYYED